MANGDSQSQGPATDQHNTPVVDPTANVRELVEAAVLRLDDLRMAEAYHSKEMASLRDRHQQEMRIAETARIDAIRAVDVGAVQQAAQVQATQATTLATQVATSAETLRNQVSAAATAQTIALAAALEPVQKDIADLRRAQYEQAGSKIQVTETQAKGAGQGMWIGIGIAAAGFMVTMGAAVVAVVMSMQP